MIFLHLLHSVLEAAQFILLFLEELISITCVLFGSMIIVTDRFMLFFQFRIFDIFDLFFVVQSDINVFFIFFCQVRLGDPVAVGLVFPILSLTHFSFTESHPSTFNAYLCGTWRLQRSLPMSQPFSSGVRPSFAQILGKIDSSTEAPIRGHQKWTVCR